MKSRKLKTVGQTGNLRDRTCGRRGRRGLMMTVGPVIHWLAVPGKRKKASPESY